MQKNIVETILGAVVLLVAAGFLFFFYTRTDAKASSNGYELTASFSKIDGLQAGSPVRISGIKVGQVTGFRLDPERYTAIVTLNIDNNVKLPTDTAAVIASAGLLDGKFMTLEPGADEDMLQPGGQIAYTQSTPSLEQLLGQVIFSLNKDKSSGGDKDADAKPAAAKAAMPAPLAAEEKPAAPETPAATADIPLNNEQPAHP